MEVHILILLLGLGVPLATHAHYDGYPFEHKNEGKYGAAHPYANYGPADAPEPEVVPEPEVTYPGYPALGYGLADHQFYHGYYPGNYGYNYGGQRYGFYGYGYGHGGAYGNHNHEFDYRSYPGFPVHQGYGQFRFLGRYNGECDAAQEHGVYLADDPASFVVCVYGRVHRFSCPKGTANSGYGHLQHNGRYGVDELCGVNTLSAN